MNKTFEVRNGILTFYNENFNSVIIPNGVCVIGKEVFCGCFEIQNIHIPDSVVIIDDFAFRKCSGLKQIRLPENLRYIGREAFAKCSSLAGITIPEGVAGIGEKAFFGCRNLRTVNCSGNPLTGRKAFFNTPFGYDRKYEEMLWKNIIE